MGLDDEDNFAREDRKRLALLGDPKWTFGYAIKPDGKVDVKEPIQKICQNLPAAIDEVRAYRGELYSCPVCKVAVPSYCFETIGALTKGGPDRQRWECPGCSATWVTPSPHVRLNKPPKAP